MSPADRGPDPANRYKKRGLVLDSAAYVIRQTTPNGPWTIVDRSGPARSGHSSRPFPDGSDPMAAMEESAKDRQEVAERLQPDGHVLFMAVRKAELHEYGIP